MTKDKLSCVGVGGLQTCGKKLHSINKWGGWVSNCKEKIFFMVSCPPCMIRKFNTYINVAFFLIYRHALVCVFLVDMNSLNTSHHLYIKSLAQLHYVYIYFLEDFRFPIHFIQFGKKILVRVLQYPFPSITYDYISDIV